MFLKQSVNQMVMSEKTNKNKADFYRMRAEQIGGNSVMDCEKLFYRHGFGIAKLALLL